jgi:hypothetical protein
MLTRMFVFSHCTCKCLICGMSGVASGHESSPPPPIPPPWGGPYAGGGGRWLGGPYTARCSRGRDAESTRGASLRAPYEQRKTPCSFPHSCYPPPLWHLRLSRRRVAYEDVLSSGMLRRVFSHKCADISEVPTASIIRSMVLLLYLDPIFRARLTYRHDDWGIKHLWTVCRFLLDYTAQHPGIQQLSSNSADWLVGQLIGLLYQ